jgi:integrase
MQDVINKMRLYDDNGGRLYLSVKERELFRDASRSENKEQRMFCRILHDTGCRPSEALALTAENIMLSEMNIQFRSLKKRKFDKQGNIKDPEYRLVPIHEKLIDLTFDLKKVQQNQREKDKKYLPKADPLPIEW